MAFKLDGKQIGPDAPIYLMAEVGTTANGDVATAHRLIDAAKSAGFDAIKFQNISPKDYMSDRAVMYKYMTAAGPQEKNMFGMLNELTFDRTAWTDIMAYARVKGITCFATVNWLGGIDMMEELGAPAYKLASWELNYPDIQRRILRTGKPVFVDLGPIDLLEVLSIQQRAMEAANDKLVFLYDFHTNNLDEMHLRAIPYLQEKLDNIVGFSSPGKASELDLVSVGLGAKVLEKRITLNDKDLNHHHYLAICGDEIPHWVSTIRAMETALGQRKLIPSQADLHDAKKYFRSVTALRPIRKGELLSPENLGAKRPMNGLAPLHLDAIWGSVATADIAVDTQIGWEHVDLNARSTRRAANAA